MTALSAPAFRLTGRHVLIILLLFFALVIGTDVAFAVLAYRSFSGQSADNPYEAGLLYNRTLTHRRWEAALGWTVAISADGSVATLTDRDGRPVTGLKITADLVRPATEKGRRKLNYRPLGDGRYQADLTNLKGAWDINATAWNREGESFEFQHRLVRP